MSRDDRGECSLLSKLPDELLVEILCRLPAKTLVSSNCVCKSWYQLITSICVPRVSAAAPISGLFYLTWRRHGHYGWEGMKSFNYAAPGHLHPARVKNELAFENDFMYMTTLSHALDVDSFDIDWIDCCNGLILFTRDSIPWYSVYNPTTKQLVEIPRDSVAKGKRVRAALAFHPLEAPDFKVVQFNHWPVFPASETVTLDVFSSETGEWITHPVSFETQVKVATWNKRCVYLNGGIYRLSHSNHLLHFDLNQVSARAIELPSKETIDAKGGFIGASRGRLYYSNHDGSTLFVWVLDDTRSWVLKHTININDFASHRFLGARPHSGFRPTSSWFKPYALDPHSEAIFIGVPTALFRYDVNDRKMELVLSLCPNRTIAWGNYTMFTYTPSLVPLKNCRYCDCNPWHT